MRYVKEEDLRNRFWKLYGSRKNIIAYQFETATRSSRGTDLITIERVPEKDGGFHIEFVAWEFKLDDIIKALSQANNNAKHVHKSYIVIPEHKKQLILDKYSYELSKYPNIGCVSVEYEGAYDFFHKARAKNDSEIELSQEILKICCGVIK